jgi:hypothetical protein
MRIQPPLRWPHSIVWRCEKDRTDQHGFDFEKFTEAMETSTVTKTAQTNAADWDFPLFRQLT